MKFLFTADIHLSGYSQDFIDKDTGISQKLKSIKQVLYQMGEYCRNNKIETFIIGGDLYHTKSIIHSLAQDILFEFIKYYNDLNFIILDGNHDISDRGDRPISSLKPLRECKNVVWVETKNSLILENICFIPYSTNLKQLLQENKSDILISHFGLNEAQLSSGISIVSEVGIKDLKNYKLVLLGHYHKPQMIKSGATTVYYVGSPIQLDWGEKGEEKRFLIVDTETLEVESIPTVGYRKHIELEINKENKKDVLEELKKFSEEGHYVKLIKTDDVKIEELQNDSLTINVIDKTEKDITDRGITSSMTQEERMKRYLEIKKIDEALVEQYMRVGLEIIEQVEV